jgi:hypothetical protein
MEGGSMDRHAKILILLGVVIAIVGSVPLILADLFSQDPTSDLMGERVLMWLSLIVGGILLVVGLLKAVVEMISGVGGRTTTRVG